jgi:hypothetical protein
MGGGVVNAHDPASQKFFASFFSKKAALAAFPHG